MITGFKGIQEVLDSDVRIDEFPKWVSEQFYGQDNEYIRVDVHQGTEQYLKIASVACKWQQSDEKVNKYSLIADVINVHQGKIINENTCDYLYEIYKTTRKMSIEIDGKYVYIPTNQDAGMCMADVRFRRNAGELIWWLYTGDDFYHGRDVKNITLRQLRNSNDSQAIPVDKSSVIANNATTDKSNGGGLVQWGLIVFLVIAMFAWLGSSDKDKANKAPAKPTTQNTQSAQQSAPRPTKKVKIEPVARAGVVTGYASDGLYLNDDGMCELTIDNTRNDMPVYVRLWDMEIGRPVRAFYIRSGDSFTATELTPSTYEVRYIELYDNDVPAKGSRSEQFTMEQVDYGSFVQYSQMSLTLYKVHGGNTTTTSIDADDI